MDIKNKIENFTDRIKNKVENFTDRVNRIKKSLTLKIAQRIIANFNVGKTGQSPMVSKIVGIAVGIMVVAIVFPIALDELANISLGSDMSAVEPLLTLLLPVIAVISIVLYITGKI